MVNHLGSLRIPAVCSAHIDSCITTIKFEITCEEIVDHDKYETPGYGFLDVTVLQTQCVHVAFKALGQCR